MEGWLAGAAIAVLFGSVWQCVLDIKRQLNAMSFLQAHNAIVRDEFARIDRDVARWRFRRRRQAKKLAVRDVFGALTPEEMAQSRDYDRSGLGWSAVVVGTLTATVIAVMQWVASWPPLA